MENPIVSIIIPTFNRANVIERAINSVLLQTFKNWEIIIINDGSLDNTKEIIEELKKKDKRINLINLDKNSGGASLPRNVGLQNARGNYIAFLDSDDEWLPEKLDKQLEIFKKSDNKLGIVYTGANFINKDNNEIRIKKVYKKGNILEEETAYNPIGSPSRVMIKSQCFKDCGIFDESIFCHEDWDLWIRMTAKYETACINIPLVNYFESANSTSIDSNKLINGYKKLWDKHNILNQKKWIQACHFVRLGHRLCYYGECKLGREYLWKAIIMQPFNIKNIFLFALSLAGSSLYKKTTFIMMKII